MISRGRGDEQLVCGDHGPKMVDRRLRGAHTHDSPVVRLGRGAFVYISRLGYRGKTLIYARRTNQNRLVFGDDGSVDARHGHVYNYYRHGRWTEIKFEPYSFENVYGVVRTIEIGRNKKIRPGVPGKTTPPPPTGDERGRLFFSC